MNNYSREELQKISIKFIEDLNKTSPFVYNNLNHILLFFNELNKLNDDDFKWLNSQPIDFKSSIKVKKETVIDLTSQLYKELNLKINSIMDELLNEKRIHYVNEFNNGNQNFTKYERKLNDKNEIIASTIKVVPNYDISDAFNLTHEFMHKIIGEYGNIIIHDNSFGDIKEEAACILMELMLNKHLMKDKEYAIESRNYISNRVCNIILSILPFKSVLNIIDIILSNKENIDDDLNSFFDIGFNILDINFKYFRSVGNNFVALIIALNLFYNENNLLETIKSTIDGGKFDYVYDKYLPKNYDNLLNNFIRFKNEML